VFFWIPPSPPSQYFLPKLIIKRREVNKKKNGKKLAKKCAKYYMMHVTLHKVYSPIISFNALTNI